MKPSLYLSFHRHSIGASRLSFGSTASPLASSLSLFLSPLISTFYSLTRSTLPPLVLPSPLSPSLDTCAFSSSFSPPAISPSSACNHARIIFTHSHTHAAHKTSRVTFYPSQVHTLSLTAFERCSSHARQQGTLRSSILSPSLSQPRHLRAPFHRLSPALFRSHSRRGGSWSSLSRARSERPARRSSLSHALSISRRGPPTAISSTRPRYLSRTSRRPIIRCGSRSGRFAYLAGRSFGDRPIGRSSDRKRETKEHFYFLCRTQQGILPLRYLIIIIRA